jgi:Fe-S cluster biosynthesis and repair protein YggX
MGRKNEVPEFEWSANRIYDEGGRWEGFPREKELLINFRELNLLGAKQKEFAKRDRILNTVDGP